jgi:hypothetical protein
MRSRKCGFIHPLPHPSSWRRAWLVKNRVSFTFFLPIIICFGIRHSAKLKDKAVSVLIYTITTPERAIRESGTIWR